jgi:hypothetical protein
LRHALGEFRKDDFKNTYIEKCMQVIHNRNPYSVNHPILQPRVKKAAVSKTSKASPRLQTEVFNGGD